MFAALRSRRALAGGIALAAGAAVVATPVTAPPLAAGPLDGDADVSPTTAEGSGTYESCTALLGLTDKDNANYVTFTVDGTADPLPQIGDGLTPVVTLNYDGSGETVECTPEIGFDDEASWGRYIGADEGVDPLNQLALALLPYPGTVGYLVPKTAALTLEGDLGLAVEAPSSIDLRIEAEDATNTVTWGPEQLVFPNPEDSNEVLIDELGGPGSPLVDRLVALGDGSDPCTDPPDQGYLDLVDAIISLTGLPAGSLDFAPICNRAEFAGELRLIQIVVAGFALPATITVDAPTPPGPNPPGPTPTPVTPAFTG